MACKPFSPDVTKNTFVASDPNKHQTLNDFHRYIFFSPSNNSQHGLFSCAALLRTQEIGHNVHFFGPQVICNSCTEWWKKTAEPRRAVRWRAAGEGLHASTSSSVQPTPFTVPRCCVENYSHRAKHEIRSQLYWFWPKDTWLLWYQTAPAVSTAEPQVSLSLMSELLGHSSP